MRHLKYIFGFLLLGIGIVGLGMERQGFLPFVRSLFCAMCGGLLLNRAITNRPIFPDETRKRQMLINARQKWPLGCAGISLLALDLLLALFGNPSFLGYSQTSPVLFVLAFNAVAAFGAFLLWRFLKFVKFGAQSDHQS